LHEKVIRQIRFEIEQLFESYAKLLEKAQQRKPDLVEVTAIASVLHSFYNGLENIFCASPKELTEMFQRAVNGIVICSCE
jgi:hypothetical protein